MNWRLIAWRHVSNISGVKQKNIIEKLKSQFKPFTIDIVITIYISFVIDNILINIVYNYTELFTVQLVKKHCVEINIKNIYFSSVETPYQYANFQHERIINRNFSQCDLDNYN